MFQNLFYAIISVFLLCGLMSLSKIKNKLYKRDFEEELSRRGESEFDVKAKESASLETGSEFHDAWEEKGRGLDTNQKKILKIGLIIVVAFLLIAAAIVGVVKFKQSSFSEERVVVSLRGPQEAESGKLLTYEIYYQNNNRASLKDASLRVSYPENFKPDADSSFKMDGDTHAVFSLGQIGSGAEGKAVLNGKVYSPKGTLMYLKADLIYTPSGLQSQFSSKNQLGVRVSSTPITLEVFAPQNLSSGDSLDYLITYKNNGAELFEDIRIKAEYPEGFTFSAANPPAYEGNNAWYIGDLLPGKEGKIVVSGKLEGEREVIKSVRVYAGSMSQGQFAAYNEEKYETKIVASPLTISQTVNDTLDFQAVAGEELRFRIQYKNEGDVGLRDVIVTDTLQSAVLDYETLELPRGAFDLDKKMLTWKASDYPELKNLPPGQEGKIEFSIKVKNVIPMEKKEDKNFVISSIARIDSPDVPTPIQMNKVISGNKLDIKLSSKLILETRGFYQDPLISNSGPIPPAVNQETTYTFRWIAKNVSNDVSNARVEAVLPTGVVMTGKTEPQDAKLAYNERTNSLVWDIGNMAAGTGIISPSPEVAFQVKLKPSPNQAGSAADLLGISTIYAKDMFTNGDLTAVSDAKNTVLREDLSIGDMGYKVVN